MKLKQIPHFINSFSIPPPISSSCRVVSAIHTSLMQYEVRLVVVSVENTAVASDVPVSTALHAHPPQLRHGVNKRLIKGLGISGPCVHRGSGSRVREQNLVRREQTHSLLEVLEVYVVECSRRDWVHVDRHSGVHILRAHLL